jgi:tRNA modification GTPase
MLSRQQDPILAIATSPGRGSVGIVRVSGKHLGSLVHGLFARPLKAREATYLPFLDQQGQPIDQGLALFFPAPHSFTGEDVLELHAHGGPIVLQLLMARCIEISGQLDPRTSQLVLPGLRFAQAGEFTERAFHNDKIDLAQAEAIADLIDASTEAAARSATQSLSGVFSKKIDSLCDALIHLRMLVEATLDFPEEEIDFLKQADATGQLESIRENVTAVLVQATQGALLREGFKVVIAGQPNAGKSSLLNALAGAERAIVTPFAGTTRDRVQETIQIEGVPVHIIDTAGLRISADEVEQIGISKAWEAIGAADVVLFLHDLTRSHMPEYITADEVIAGELAAMLPANTQVVDVWNKSDAVGTESGSHRLTISAKTGTGLQGMRNALLKSVGWRSTSDGLFIARQRHLHALQRVQLHLKEATVHLMSASPSLDLLAEELRQAQNTLGEITGQFTSDDLLGVIFSKFCIGK